MKKWITAGVLLLVGIAVFITRQTGPAPADDSPAPSAAVSTIQLVQHVVPVQIPAFGSIAAGTAETDIALAAPGIVTSVPVRPGEDVVAGQVLASIAPDAQSVADLRRAQDAVQAAQAVRAHMAALFAGHLATSADLAAATQALADAAANLKALEVLGTGLRRSVTAPFAGVVTSVAARPGGTLQAGTILFKLVAPGGLSAIVGLPEAQADRVTPGDAAMLTALNTGTQIAATVVQRATMLDPQTGLVDITLAPHSALPLGEPLAVTITAGNVTGYKVPRDAVLNDAAGDYVFQLDTQDVAHRETAHVLEPDGAVSVLAPDLDPAMPLVTTGAYQLAEGMKATVQGSGH
jgi:RND family efflux transporter MFP subunit